MPSKTPILDHLIETMAEVVENNKPLYMWDFYMNTDVVRHIEDLFSDENMVRAPTARLTIHNCGTAACIVGYAAINNPPLSDDLTMCARAQEIAMEITGALEDEIGRAIAISIYEPTPELRRFSIPEREQFELLSNHPHVQKDHDDPQIALDYLLKVKEYVNETDTTGC